MAEAKIRTATTIKDSPFTQEQLGLKRQALRTNDAGRYRVILGAK